MSVVGADTWFDKGRLPPGYFLFSAFGVAALKEQFGYRDLTPSGTVPFGPSKRGVGVNWNGGGATSHVNYATFAIPAQFTMEALIQVGTVQNENILSFVNAAGADTGTFDRQVAIRTTGVFSFYVFTGAINIVSGTTVFSTGDTVHIAFCYDGTTYRLYLNGVLDASSALGAAFGGFASPALTIGQQPVATGGGGTTTSQSTHVLLLSAMANRALLPGEVKMRAAYPWAPFDSPRRRVFKAPATAASWTSSTVWL